MNVCADVTIPCPSVIIPNLASCQLEGDTDKGHAMGKTNQQTLRYSTIFLILFFFFFINYILFPFKVGHGPY